MGISFNGHAGAIDWIQSRFAAGRPATLYYDEIRTPAYVNDLNCLFEIMLANHWSGLFHAPGSRSISLYQIAQVINRVGEYDPGTLFGCYRIEAGPIPPRAGNVTMSGRKLRDLLGFNPLSAWPAKPSLVPQNRKWHYAGAVDSLSTANGAAIAMDAKRQSQCFESIETAKNVDLSIPGNLENVIRYLYS